MDILTLPPAWQAACAALQMGAVDLPADPMEIALDLAADGTIVVTADGESVEIPGADVEKRVAELLAKDSAPPPPPLPTQG